MSVRPNAKCGDTLPLSRSDPERPEASPVRLYGQIQVRVSNKCSDITNNMVVPHTTTNSKEDGYTNTTNTVKLQKACP